MKLGLRDGTGDEGEGKLNVEVQGLNQKPEPHFLRPACHESFSAPVLEVEVGCRAE